MPRLLTRSVRIPSAIYTPKGKVAKPPRKLFASMIGGPWHGKYVKLDANLTRTETFSLNGLRGYYSVYKSGHVLSKERSSVPLANGRLRIIGYKWFWHHD